MRLMELEILRGDGEICHARAGVELEAVRLLREYAAVWGNHSL